MIIKIIFTILFKVDDEEGFGRAWDPLYSYSGFSSWVSKEISIITGYEAGSLEKPVAYTVRD